MILNDKQTKYLRKLGHDLKPVVWIGNAGLSEAVFNELELTLEHHELIKARIRLGDRAERNEMVEILCKKTGAALVQKIGQVALIYRPAKELPRIVLPA